MQWILSKKTVKTKTSVEKRRKILTGVLCVFAAVLIIGSALVYNGFKKEFQSSTKNAVAMGTVVTAKTYGKNTASINETIVSCVQQLDDVISWRVKDSAVSKINSGQTVGLSSLSSAINACNDVSKNSNGAFDVTIGPVSTLWGFGTENERLPKKAEIENALKKVDYKKLKVSGSKISCAKGQFVDLGAVGKGYACDLVKQYLEKTDVSGAVVSVGGSILAYGKRNKAGDKWRIAVRDPRNENGFIGTVLVKEGFVSTSGDYEKYFEKAGVRYHHLLDARTGYPANSGLISVTVVCSNGLLSDALSTACFVLGKEEGQKLLEKYGASGVFVDSSQNVTTFGDIDFERAAQ